MPNHLPSMFWVSVRLINYQMSFSSSRYIWEICGKKLHNFRGGLPPLPQLEDRQTAFVGCFFRTILLEVYWTRSSGVCRPSRPQNMEPPCSQGSRMYLAWRLYADWWGFIVMKSVWNRLVQGKKSPTFLWFQGPFCWGNLLSPASWWFGEEWLSMFKKWHGFSC